jgi:hypothetical protein
MAFWSLSMADLLHVLLARSGAMPAIGYERGLSRPVFVGLGISALLQLGVLLMPSLRSFSGARTLGLADGLISLAGAVAPIMAIEIRRMVGRARPTPEPIQMESPRLLKEAA